MQCTPNKKEEKKSRYTVIYTSLYIYKTKTFLEKKIIKTKYQLPHVTFLFQVESNTGADGYGYIINYSDNYTITADYGDEYKIQYKVHQVYGSSDPSICEVYFTVTSKAVIC